MSKLGKVGPYTLVERLGRGGMGEVYLAATRRGEHVALKVLHDLVEDETSRIRLEREVRALRRVESPYVAKVLDADLSCARPYLVMEHIEGVTLLDRVRQSGSLDVAGLVDLAQGIAAALAIIHAAGVVHRDLKPGNIIMATRGPVLIDFGIAQVLDATRLTMTGTFLGTPGYTAPEIFADEHVDSPADVHAWAATVAFAATGRPTFGRGTAEAQMYAVLNGQADLKGVPVELLPLVRAALNREPGKRPTAALLADRLSRLARATNAATTTATGETEAGAVSGAGRAADAVEEAGKGTAVRSRTAEEAAPGRGEAKARSRPNAVPTEGKVPAPRARTANRAGSDGGRSGNRAGTDGGRTGNRAASDGGRSGGRAGTDPGRAGNRAGSDGGRSGSRAGADGGRTGNRAGADPGRAGNRAASDGKGAALARSRAEGKVPAPRGRAGGDGKNTGPRDKMTASRQRTAAALGGRRAAKSQDRRRTAGLRAESATTLPAGNGALLLLAVLAVPCVVVSVIWPIASIAITAVFVVLTRTLWMGHWMVWKRSSRRTRVALRVLLFPVALVGSAATAVVWPGVPVAVTAGSALGHRWR
ncbi:protein kinase [Nonomuraea antimicrobica]